MIKLLKPLVRAYVALVTFAQRVRFSRKSVENMLNDVPEHFKAGHYHTARSNPYMHNNHPVTVLRRYMYAAMCVWRFGFIPHDYRKVETFNPRRYALVQFIRRMARYTQRFIRISVSLVLYNLLITYLGLPATLLLLVIAGDYRSR